MSQHSEHTIGIAAEPLSPLATSAETSGASSDRTIAAFRYSQVRTFGLIAAAGLAAAASGAMAFGYLPVRGGIGTAVGYIGLVFFGAGVLIYVSRLFARGPVVVVSRHGC